MNRDNLVLFAHIPKSAGMTMWAIAKHNYLAQDFVYYDIRWSLSKLAQYIEKNSELKLAMGHFGLGFHQLLPNSVSYVTMLREPIQRTISDYYYYQQSEMPINNYNPPLSWQEFCARLANNTMTRFYSGLEFTYIKKYNSFANLRVAKINNDAALKDYYNYPATELLQLAKQHLKQNFSLVGIVEQFDLSLLLLQQYLGWKNIYYVKRNLGTEKPKSEINSQIHNCIIKHNQLDIKLYEYALELFQQQIDSCDFNLNRQLPRFQKANQRYEKLVNSTQLQDNVWNNLPSGLS